MANEKMQRTKDCVCMEDQHLLVSLILACLSAGVRVKRLLFLVLSIVWLTAGLLSSCTFPAAVRPEPMPTLAATLELVILPSVTPAPTLSPIPTASLSPSATFTPIPSATETVTPSPTDTPTFGPSPTVTRTATITRIPTQTRPPTRTPTVTFTPTITFTPTPPAPSIDLVRPGLLSKVTSPIGVQFNALAGEDNRVTIELVGEDGRVISRQMERYGVKPGRRFWIAPDLPFEISAAAEMARLQVSIQDQYGRTQALASTDLILLSVGRDEINPPAVTQEPFLIRQPKTDAITTGGILALDGLARPINNSPLIIELVNEKNTVLIVKQLQVPSPTGPLSHTPFHVEIPYRVSELTPVRLVIRQEGSRIPGTVALVSETIVLAP